MTVKFIDFSVAVDSAYICFVHFKFCVNCVRILLVVMEQSFNPAFIDTRHATSIQWWWYLTAINPFNANASLQGGEGVKVLTYKNHDNRYLEPLQKEV